MKIEALKEYIRKVVKDEVRNVLKEELRYQLTEIILGGGNDIKSINKNGNAKTFIKKSETKTEPLSENKPSEPKKKVRYTSNPVLNDILNETTSRIQPEGSMVGLNGSFDVIGGGDSSMINESVTPQPPPDAPEPIKKVFDVMNRDYRALMKAVDKKQGRV